MPDSEEQSTCRRLDLVPVLPWERAALYAAVVVDGTSTWCFGHDLISHRSLKGWSGED